MQGYTPTSDFSRRAWLLKEFERAGGKYMDYVDVFNKLKVDKQKDTFYTVCDTGETRSQVLRLVLNASGYKTELPHGTGVGNDIFYNKDDYKYFDPLTPSKYLRHNPRHRAFLEVFKQNFVARAGEKHVLCEDLELFGDDYGPHAGDYLPDMATHMKQWFTEHYFALPQKGERKIFLCFTESAIHVIERFLMTWERVPGIVVIRLPFETVAPSQLREAYNIYVRSLESLFE